MHIDDIYATQIKSESKRLKVIAKFKSKSIKLKYMEKKTNVERSRRKKICIKVNVYVNDYLAPYFKKS